MSSSSTLVVGAFRSDVLRWCFVVVRWTDVDVAEVVL